MRHGEFVAENVTLRRAEILAIHGEIREATQMRTTKRRFLPSELVGSTRAMTDEKGVVIGRWKYYPFGQEAESLGGGASWRRP